MEGIRRYLLSVIAAAIICSIASTLVGSKGTYTSLVKMVCGLFLAFCVISPWMNLDITDFSALTDVMRESAVQASADGEIMAAEATGEIIKAKTQAYILDKAASMGLDVEVDVMLDEQWPQSPCAVTINGEVSPYARQVLSRYISDNLAIAKEDQHWS